MTRRRRSRPLRTRREIKDAQSAFALLGILARGHGDDQESQQVDYGASLVVGALAWVSDERGAFDEFRDQFEELLNQMIHDFDQASAAVRERHSEGKEAETDEDV